MIRTLLMFKIIFTSLFVYSNESSCDYHQYASSNLKSYSEIMSQVTSKQPQIYILAENHFQSGTSRLHHVLSDIFKKDEGTYCVFLEYDPNVPKMREFVLGMGFFSEIKKVTENFNGSFILVDELKAKDKNFLSKNMTARNQNMSDNIESAILSKKCEKGILIVGKAHNYSVINDIEVPSIQEILTRQKGISAVSVDIIDSFWFNVNYKEYGNKFPPAEKQYMSANQWDKLAASCESQSVDLKAFTGFMNLLEKKSCRMPYTYFEKSTEQQETKDSEPTQGQWGTVCDFDASIIL